MTYVKEATKAQNKREIKADPISIEINADDYVEPPPRSKTNAGVVIEL
jgi:hypothetical protein